MNEIDMYLYERLFGDKGVESYTKEELSHRERFIDIALHALESDLIRVFELALMDMEIRVGWEQEIIE